MSSQNRLNVVLPGGIGTAGKIKQITNRFVRSEPKEGSLRDGFLLLRMTADELFRVHKIVGELQRGYPDGFDDLTWDYNFLMDSLEALLHKRTNTNALNFVKRNQLREKAETLCRSGNELYDAVKTVSKNVEKELQDFRIANARVKEVKATEVAANEQVMGFSLDEPLEPETASLVDVASYYTALDEPYTDSMSLGDADGHSTHSDIPDSGIVSSAENMTPDASSVLASRVDNPASPGGDVCGFGAAPQNGTSSSPSPINRTGNQKIPPPVPDPVGDNIPDVGSHPGVQNVASISSHPPIDLEQLTDLIVKASHKPPSVHYHGGFYQQCLISPNAVNPTLMNDGYKNSGPKYTSTGNAAPNPQQAGLGAQGAAYPTPARSPGEPSPPEWTPEAIERLPRLSDEP